MFKNGMGPLHSGDVLQGDSLKPPSMSVNALAKLLHLPAPRSR